jgi:capsular exopolysaccharide synthesis family protein
MGRNDDKNEIAMRMNSVVPNRRRSDALSVDVMKYSQTDESNELHLRDYLDIIVRRKWIVIIFLCSVVLTVAVASYFITPLYRATATIQLGGIQNNLLSFKDAYEGGSNLETQYNILKSHNLAQRVLASFPADYTISSPASQSFLKQNDEKPKMPVTLGDIRSGLEVVPVKKSDIVNLVFISHDPELASKAANAYADEYVNYTRDSKLGPTQSGSMRLEKEVNDMRNKLETSEKKLNQFVANSKYLYSKSDQDYENLLTKKLSIISNDLDQASSDRIAKESVFKEIKNSGIDYEVILRNPTIQNLTMDRIKLETEYSKLLKIHKPEYPKMIYLKEEIDKINSSIETEKNKVINTVESDYRLALQKEKSLSQSLDAVQKEVNTFQKTMVKFQILNREVTTNRDIYNSLLQRFKEVDISVALTDSDVQIIDRASKPRLPFKPRWIFNLALSIVFGFAGGVFIAFFAEYFDNTVKSEEDIAKASRLPLLGKVPSSDSSPKKLLKDNTDHNAAFAEAFRSISTCIQFSNADRPPKKILVTSPIEKEGKTLISTSIAMSLISSHEKGIIIDADLRRPDVHELFDIDNSIGLSSFLAGISEFEGLVKKSPYEGLDVICAGPVPPNPSELLNSTRMKELIEALSTVYDYIIIDSPPVLGMSDSLVLSTVSEGVVVVVKANSTPKEALTQTNYSLRSVNAKMLGVVLNGVEVKKKYAQSSYYSSPYLNSDKDTRKIL